MTTFKEQVYELAFGDDAINKDYSEEEVLAELKKHSQELELFLNSTVTDLLEALELAERKILELRALVDIETWDDLESFGTIELIYIRKAINKAKGV